MLSLGVHLMVFEIPLNFFFEAGNKKRKQMKKLLKYFESRSNILFAILSLKAK